MLTKTARFMILKELDRDQVGSVHKTEDEIERELTAREISVKFRLGKYWGHKISESHKEDEARLMDTKSLSLKPFGSEFNSFLDYQHAWDWNVYNDVCAVNKLEAV